MIDLAPHHLETVLRILAEHVPHAEVRAFGSRATWDAQEHSDLDLAVDGDRRAGSTVIARLKEAFEESDLPIRVDVIDWHAIADSFRAQIEASCVVLQKRDHHSHWPHVPLGEFVTNFDSRRVPLSRRVRSTRQGPFPYYGATGILDHVDDYIFEGLHLLVAEDGSVETPNGNPFLQLVDGQFWVNNHAHIIRGSSDDETRYLYYALSAVQVRPFVSGSVQEKLSQANLNRIPVPYPSQESERSEIVNILGTLDDKLELNRRRSDTLDEMARALFRSWFVDFDPVRAKADDRPSGLPAMLDELFPNSFQRSEIGEIPAGWQVKSLSDCLYVEKGLSYKGAGLSTTGVPLHNLNSIYEGGGYKLNGIKYYSSDYRSRHLVEPEDIIVANTEQGHDRLLIGFAAMVPRHYGPKGLFSHHLYRIRPRRETGLSSDYICHLLNSDQMQQTTSAYATGTTVNMLPLDALAIPKAALPPRRLVEHFTSCSVAMRTHSEGLVNQSHTLSHLRDTLLPKLLSGELRVRGTVDAPAPA